jgi:hypothetical protein
LFCGFLFCVLIKLYSQGNGSIRKLIEKLIRFFYKNVCGTSHICFSRRCTNLPIKLLESEGFLGRRGSSRVWIQGLVLLLYHLNHSFQQPFFALVIFEIVSYFMPMLTRTTIFLFVLLHVAGMTGTPTIGSHWLR